MQDNMEELRIGEESKDAESELVTWPITGA